MFKILLVEDNKKLSDSVRDYLSAEFDVTAVYDGADAIAYYDYEEYDLVVLDLMLPNVDGISVLRHINGCNKNAGVIILTAKEALDDKLTAFELGTNDYLTKPFYMEELKARIYAVLRSIGKLETVNKISFRDLYIDLTQQKCMINTPDGRVEIQLQEKLLRLLEYFLINRNTLLFKNQIFSRICGIDSDAGESIIEVYVSMLRKKLAPYGYDKYIVTKRGMGYIFNEGEE
ncbi:MAG: response regulator transcription factor [Clostridia bacterium]|nr:response regulator transcription factor [Clostridia bacterium]